MTTFYNYVVVFYIDKVNILIYTLLSKGECFI